MQVEQESEENNTYHSIQELIKQYKAFKGRISVEEIEGIINKVKDLLKDRDFAEEMFEYCKVNHPELVAAVRQFKSRTEKKDNQIVIEGETGNGKSVLTMCICAIFSYIMRRKFTFDKDVIYFPKENELASRLETLNEYDILWVDETIKSLYKAKWMNKSAMKSNETVQTERFRHNTVIYCLPNFSELTKSFRDVNIKFRIWCMTTEPATAILRVKERHPDIIQKYGAWHFDERCDLLRKGKITPLSTPKEYMDIERRLPGYATDFSWPDVEKVHNLCGWHFLYELMKKHSRLVSRRADEEAAKKEPALSINERKREKVIISIISHFRKTKPDSSFADWKKQAPKDMALNEETMRSYWHKAEPEKLTTKPPTSPFNSSNNNIIPEVPPTATT
jgi:hypothetical protein